MFPEYPYYTRLDELHRVRLIAFEPQDAGDTWLPWPDIPSAPQGDDIEVLDVIDDDTLLVRVHRPGSPDVDLAAEFYDRRHTRCSTSPPDAPCITWPRHPYDRQDSPPYRLSEPRAWVFFYNSDVEPSQVYIKPSRGAEPLVFGNDTGYLGDVWSCSGFPGDCADHTFPQGMSSTVFGYAPAQWSHAVVCAD